MIAARCLSLARSKPAFWKTYDLRARRSPPFDLPDGPALREEQPVTGRFNVILSPVGNVNVSNAPLPAPCHMPGAGTAGRTCQSRGLAFVKKRRRSPPELPRTELGLKVELSFIMHTFLNDVDFISSYWDGKVNQARAAGGSFRHLRTHRRTLVRRSKSEAQLAYCRSGLDTPSVAVKAENP